MIKKLSLPHQSAFVQAPYVFNDKRFFFLIAGYAAGKTSALVDAVLRSVKENAGKKDREGNSPKIGVCGITLTFLKKTFVGRLVEALRQSKTEYNYDKAHNIIYVAGVELHLTPIINEEEIFGFDWGCAFVDELDELPIYKAVAVVKAINDRCRQQVQGVRPPFLAFATTSQGLKGTYQVVDSFKKRGIGHVIIRARTKDNIFLPKEYVDAQYRIYNEKERRCLLEGEFISIDQGLVYPDYDPTFNRTMEDLYLTVTPDEPVYIGQDFNTGFFKAVAAVVRDGRIIVVKTYNFPDIRSAPEVFRFDFKFNPIRWIPDATYNQNLPQFRNELRSNKIAVIYRAKNPLVRDRAFLINKLFHTGRLLIPENCQDLDIALSQRQVDKNTGLPEKGKGESAPDHICFSGDTLIATSKGMKEIRHVRKGDLVLTQKGYKKVLAWGITGFEEVKDYQIAGRILSCTKDHPVWTQDGMKAAMYLNESDKVCVLNGDVYSIIPCQDIASLNARKELVYNLTVEDEHEYFANGILVSNCDSLEYMAFYLVSQLRAFKDLYKVTIGRRIEKLVDAGLAEEKDMKYNIREEVNVDELSIA